MDRDKLLERARKLYAMSQDLSSPAEAAIADRRLSALMQQHHITLEQIRITPEHSSPVTSEQPVRQEVRRKRKRKRTSARSSPKPKETRTTAHLDRVAAVIALCGIGLSIIVWITFTTFESSGEQHTSQSEALQLGTSAEHGTPALTSNVERAALFEGESVTLYINGSAISRAPDISGLASDFVIIGKQINSDRGKDAFQIRLVLQPRKTGVLFIPSFTVDGVRSAGIMVNVSPGK